MKNQSQLHGSQIWLSSQITEMTEMGNDRGEKKKGERGLDHIFFFFFLHWCICPKKQLIFPHIASLPIYQTLYQSVSSIYLVLTARIGYESSCISDKYISCFPILNRKLQLLVEKCVKKKKKKKYNKLHVSFRQLSDTSSEISFIKSYIKFFRVKKKSCFLLTLKVKN